MRTELIKAPFSESFGLLQAEWKRIYAGMFRIELASVILVMLAFMAAIGAFLVLDGFGPILRLAVAAALFIPIMVASMMVKLLSYNFVDSLWSRKKMSFGDTFRENALPAIGYMIVRALISIVILGPILALMFFFILGSAVSDYNYLLDILLNLVFRIAIGVASAAIALFTQFAIFELLIARNGVLDSFGKGYSIVRRNFFETFIFSFILAVIESFVSTPFVILLAVMIIFGLFAGIALSGPAGILIIGITALACFVIVVAMQAALATVAIPTQYKYWSRARLVR